MLSLSTSIACILFVFYKSFQKWPEFTLMARELPLNFVNIGTLSLYKTSPLWAIISWRLLMGVNPSELVKSFLPALPPSFFGFNPPSSHSFEKLLTDMRLVLYCYPLWTMTDKSLLKTVINISYCSILHCFLLLTFADSFEEAKIFHFVISNWLFMLFIGRISFLYSFFYWISKFGNIRARGALDPLLIYYISVFYLSGFSVGKFDTWSNYSARKLSNLQVSVCYTHHFWNHNLHSRFYWSKILESIFII